MKWCCFTSSIRKRSGPSSRDPVLLEDLETGDTIEVSPEYAAKEYPAKIDAHLEDI